MVVGVLKVTLRLEAAFSLKDKRRVVKSLVERTQNRFHVAIAEVEDNDVWERAVLGVAAVANDRAFVNSLLDKVLDAIEDAALGKALVVDSQLELMNV